MRTVTPPIHVVGNRTWAVELGSELLVMDPGFDCRGLSAAEALEKPTSTVARLRRLVETTGSAVGLVVLSHDHWDHSANLPAFLELQDSAGFEFELVTSAHSPVGRRVAVDGGHGCRLIDGDETLERPGGPVVLLSTPGHTPWGDDLCVWLPEQAVLFAGDLPQPQGPAYEVCDFDSPFSNHADDRTAAATLARLDALPFDTLLLGHEGQALLGRAGHDALNLTLRVLDRTAELANRLTAENPGLPAATYIEWIFDTVAFERGFDRTRCAARKTTGHRGPCPACSTESFYWIYDCRAIESAVRRVLGEGR